MRQDSGWSPRRWTLRDIPVQRKLMLVMLLVTFIALLLASVAFVANTVFTFRIAKAQDLLAISQILGSNCTAALSFDDARAAEDVLKTLAAKPRVTVAVVYDQTGRLFASYRRPEAQATLPPAPAPDGHHFERRKLVITSPILLNNQRIGTIHLETDLQEIEILRIAGVALAILLVSFIPAFALSSKLQQVITGPILALSVAARAVSANKDYSIRARRFGRDELGQLTDTFNEMLSEIQTQNDLLTRTEERMRGLNVELEARVHERTAQLEASNKELEAFSYSVSHDLRAPLRGIDGFSLALLEDYGQKLDLRGKEYLERVRGGTQQMAQLIDDLLNLSQVTRSEMRREQVNLSALAQTIAQEFQQAQPDRQVALVIAPGLVATGDGRLLRIALANLLDNAWKFTAKQPHPTIEFGIAQRDGQTAYCVRDNGAGFDMAYVGKLFGAFQRLHTTVEFAGTGIGLATVARIIHRHGGRVWAEGAVGQGAAFYFTL